VYPEYLQPKFVHNIIDRPHLTVVCVFVSWHLHDRIDEAS